MPQRNVYVLEHFEAKCPTVVGIFSSRRKAEALLRTLPMSYSYAVYKVPINTVLTDGNELKDQQGHFEHWHWGTGECAYWVVDDEGNEIESGTRTETHWPEGATSVQL